jgi:hypothetical protein
MSRGDLIAATVSTSQPLFEPPKLETTEPILFEDLGCLRTVSRSSNTELDLASFRAEIREIISLIAQLVSLRASSYGKLTASTASMIAFSQHCFAVEHRLLSIRVSRQENVPCHDPDIFIYEASRIAALTCVTYHFWQMVPGGETFTSLKRSFRHYFTSVEDLSETTVIGEASVRIILWACCVGGITSVDQAWFALRIHHYMSRLNIRGWEELKICLMDYVWDPKISDYFFATMWPEVQSF